jgi:hypothetical protein
MGLPDLNIGTVRLHFSFSGNIPCSILRLNIYESGVDGNSASLYLKGLGAQINNKISKAHAKIDLSSKTQKPLYLKRDSCMRFSGLFFFTCVHLQSTHEKLCHQEKKRRSLKCCSRVIFCSTHLIFH